MGFGTILLGIFVIFCTFKKFPFYWEDRKAIFLRKLIGDRGASIIYYTIGLLASIFGVLEVTNLIK